MRSLCVLSLALAVASAASVVPSAFEQAAKPATKPSSGGATKAGGAARVIEIIGTDDMKFSVNTINAKRGEQLRVRLISKGAMPKIAMAHNFVLLKLGTSQIKFAEAAAQARPTDFIPPDMKNQVIAHTGLAGAGETVEVTFKVPAAAGSYPYICTFPGHFAAGMRGNLVVK
jgi:azurin